MGSAKLTAARVRVEVTDQEGVTYELQLGGPGVLATLGIELHAVNRAADDGLGAWIGTLPTGDATITLEASGKLVKSERRVGQAPFRPATMTELIAFVRAQLDDDERVARRTDAADWVEEASWIPGISEDDIRHMGRWDPARALAEVEAKRRILDLYEEARDQARNPVSAQAYANARARQFALEQAIAALAQPYAGRPGWREEWAA